MIGTRFIKGQIDETLYAQCVDFCNSKGGAYIEDKGEYYECVAIPAPSLDELKAQKLTELKNIRDNEEVKPIAYNGNLFDYDDKARDRINAAIIALELQGEGAKISWTTADNADTPVTATDLKMIIAAVAVRSNKLHTAYRIAKEKVEAATTAADVEDVTFEV